MKKLIFKYLLISFMCMGQTLLSQTQVDKFDPKEKVYWFYLNVSVKTDQELNRDVYVVRIPSQKPKYDTYSNYEKELWRCLQAGHQIAVGPFREYDAAKQALKIFDLHRLDGELRDLELKSMEDLTQSNGEDYFCYYMKFYLTKRTRSIRLQRIPARTSVDGVSMGFFIDQFLEGLSQQMLAIGPFRTKEEAEESKRLNRLEE